MADHLVIGILIGMVSGIVALLLISALTLRRLDVAWSVEIARMQRVLTELQRAGERSARGVSPRGLGARRQLARMRVGAILRTAQPKLDGSYRCWMGEIYKNRC